MEKAHYQRPERAGDLLRYSVTPHRHQTALQASTSFPGHGEGDGRADCCLLVDRMEQHNKTPQISL